MRSSVKPLFTNVLRYDCDWKKWMCQINTPVHSKQTQSTWSAHVVCNVQCNFAMLFCVIPLLIYQCPGVRIPLFYLYHKIASRSCTNKTVVQQKMQSIVSPWVLLMRTFWTLDPSANIFRGSSKNILLRILLFDVMSLIMLHIHTIRMKHSDDADHASSF